ncbi:hypothetical protein L3X37_06510 [Sabulilitoribacter arenilitoris]|uniref:Uncharacterized protein n=1 Tax=Wocania arenilitoris TaxID=2044858 RepID=A0AAE3EN42_9FLAO|nr:hypothetical protein [Wocania arenilitoris]MCF7568016.1 hypothetical protein [Wocania arenilitoris]
MKRIVLILILIAFSKSFSQTTNLRSTNIKAKYENVFYKSPQEFNNQEQIFKVNRISFSSNYIGSKSKNVYQISVYGTVNNKKMQIVYNAKSIDELEHYRDVFKGRYKKVLLFEHAYKSGSKTHRNISISVEY